MIYKNILETIGRTPMVKINKINPNVNVEIYAKIEGVNPGGSIKDRIALKMIEQAIQDGSLTKEKIIIEPTSGNTGIALAMIGSVMGYKVEIVMSESVSVERRKMISAYGASIILTDPDLGTDGAIMKAREMVRNNPDKYFMPDQFGNAANKLAHHETAREIWEDMDGDITHIISSLGTSGTIMGISEFLKEKKPTIKIVCAYPEKNHKIQGLKNMEEAIVPALYDKNMIDEFITVSTDQACETARRLSREEGIFSGMSSGAAIFAALELARKMESGRAVVIFPDKGDKYLSTDLFC